MVFFFSPSLAAQLSAKYQDQGLCATDLRFGVWPDASPVQVREPDEPIRVHLNTFGIRQVRFGAASEPERAALEVLTHQTEELVHDAIAPAHGAAIFQFGKIATMHRHVVGRERHTDGLNNWTERQLVGLEARREMRDRLAVCAPPDRLRTIARKITAVLTRYAT